MAKEKTFIFYFLLFTSMHFQILTNLLLTELNKYFYFTTRLFLSFFFVIQVSVLLLKYGRWILRTLTANSLADTLGWAGGLRTWLELLSITLHTLHNIKWRRNVSESHVNKLFSCQETLSPFHTYYRIRTAVLHLIWRKHSMSVCRRRADVFKPPPRLLLIFFNVNDNQVSCYTKYSRTLIISCFSLGPERRPYCLFTTPRSTLCDVLWGSRPPGRPPSQRHISLMAWLAISRSPPRFLLTAHQTVCRAVGGRIGAENRTCETSVSHALRVLPVDGLKGTNNKHLRKGLIVFPSVTQAQVLGPGRFFRRAAQLKCGRLWWTHHAADLWLFEMGI